MFKLALITGASSGIGEALAYLLAEKGTPLLLTGRNEDALQKIQAQCVQKVPVDIFTSDLATAEGRKALLVKIGEKQPDLVINNAGFGIYGLATSHTEAEHARLIEVDILALTEITVSAARMLKETSRKGTILNVASAAAFQVFPYFATYAAAKAYVVSFSKALDYELEGTGIRVLVSCPGQVKTDFARRAAGREIHDDPGALVMSAAFAAEDIVRQIERGERVRVFDWKYRLLTTLSRWIPESIRAALLRRAMLSRVRTLD